MTLIIRKPSDRPAIAAPHMAPWCGIDRLLRIHEEDIEGIGMLPQRKRERLESAIARSAGNDGNPTLSARACSRNACKKLPNPVRTAAFEFLPSPPPST